MESYQPQNKDDQDYDNTLISKITFRKNNNEENMIITMIPISIWEGMAKVGGYFAFLNIGLILLRGFHHFFMKRDLQR